MLELTGLDVVTTDVDKLKMLVDGDTDGTDVVVGLKLLTLVDVVDTLELELLLDVKAELDDGVDNEVLTYGVATRPNLLHEIYNYCASIW